MTEAAAQQNRSKLLTVLIVASVMLVTIIEILDMTIVNVALPPMMGQLGANTDQITWVLTSYIVASAIVMPLTGKLVDYIGRKRLLLFAIAGFMISSMMCGLSISLAEIVVFRSLQGIFGAVLVPLSQYILRDTFSKKDQGKAMAIWGMGVMVAPVMGPTLGGYITQVLSWRWVFYINVPVCILAFILVAQVISETEKSKPYIDYIGLFLMCVGVAFLQVFLDRGNVEGWFSSNEIQVLCLIAAVLLITFFVRGIGNKKNIVDLSLFRDRNFCLSTFMFVIFNICIISSIAIQPLLLEHLMGYTAENAGWVMAPRGAASAVSMMLAGVLSKKVDQRWLLLAGVIFGDIGTFMLSNVSLQASFSVMAWEGAVQGFGMGFFFVPITVIAFNTLKESRVAEAAGLFSFGRNLGCSIGISILSTIISRETQTNWNVLGQYIQATNYNLQRWLQLHHLTLDQPVAVQRLAQTLSNQATSVAFVDAYWILGVAFTLLMPMIFFLKKTNLKHL
jgi:DHA2 family multidrug resistance protein